MVKRPEEKPEPDLFLELLTQYFMSYDFLIRQRQGIFVARVRERLPSSCCLASVTE